MAIDPVYFVQPIGVGLSYGTMVNNSVDAAHDVYDFLQKFYRAYPHLAKYLLLDFQKTMLLTVSKEQTRDLRRLIRGNFRSKYCDRDP